MAIVPPVQSPGEAFKRVPCDVGFLLTSPGSSGGAGPSAESNTVLTAVDFLKSSSAAAAAAAAAAALNGAELAAAVHDRLSTRVTMEGGNTRLPSLTDLTADDVKRLTTTIGKTRLPLLYCRYLLPLHFADILLTV